MKNPAPKGQITKPGNDPRKAPAATRIVNSRDLLGDHAELRIKHQGSEYRLRITSQGKLILTK